MDEPQLASPRQFSSGQVVVRLALRLTIFCVFASLGAAGFRVMFPTFLALAAIYCAIAAAFRGESILGRALNHWDEAAGYGAFACLITKIVHQLTGGLSAPRFLCGAYGKRRTFLSNSRSGRQGGRRRQNGRRCNERNPNP